MSRASKGESPDALTASTAPRGGALVKSPTTIASPYTPARLVRSDAIEADQLASRAREELRSAEARATEMIGAAQSQSQELMAEARREAAAVRLRAVEAGVDEGREALQSLIESINHEFSGIGEDIARRVVELAFRVAGAIVRTEFAARPESVLSLVRELLLRTRMYSRITLVLHPHDALLAREKMDQLRAIASFASEFSVREDSEQPRGSVRLETEAGAFDGGLETRLAQLGSMSVERDRTRESES